MTNLFSIQQKIITDNALKKVLFLKLAFFSILFFSFSDSFSQVTNNYIDYTNGTHGSICATAAENGNATFTAPSGTVFTTVYFSSYGSPTGSCNSYATSSCNASTSQSVVEGYLLGQSGTISIPATNTVFTDPCSGTVKQLYAQAIYTQPICIGSSPGTITGSLPSGGSGTYTYIWQKSTTGPSTGFINITGGTSQNLDPGTLTQTTWFRREVNSSGYAMNISQVLQIKIIPQPTITGASTASCVGGSTGTLTANVSGGSGTFNYSLNSGTYQSGNSFSGLSAGSYLSLI